MESIHSGIVTLLKAAVTQQPQQLPGDFSLTQAMPLIKKHSLHSLACEGAILCGVSMTDPMMPALMDGYGKNLLISEEQMLAIAGIFEAFDRKGIDYLPLKGCAMKALYPKPELRVMGDADILIRLEQYPAIAELMEELGFEFKEESNHEYVWQRPQLYLELHKCLIPSYNRDLYAYFGDGWPMARPENGHRYAMTPEITFIYLFTHFAKHYRDGGIGCRHVLDLWVYLRSHPELDLELIRAELHKLGLLTFFDNIRSLIACWFEDGIPGEREEYLTQFLFSSGNWGEAEIHILSAEARHGRAAGSAAGGRLRSLGVALFPGKDAMVQQYETVRKHPGLYPLFWPVRLCDIALFRRSAIRARKEKWKIASSERLDAYRQSLAYVGLDPEYEKEP